MRILSMTATFGKLEHETLTLEPGLNIIQAPNEWGKSTWCAFLVNMLYGIDTRARSTGTALADKERYAPWSGAAMSGRIELEWEGRRITIERRSKGRTVFGDFHAYESETGIEVPELDASNCGQKLLGVERSVFTRAGFLKLSDLPVTQDEALRRRLNNLVTTGDESGAGDKLGQTLKDLKNKCRFNNSGLLPQAENEREQLRYQLQQLQQLQTEADTIRKRQTQLEQEIHELQNHQDALKYADSIENIRQVEAAEKALQDANELVTVLEAQCSTLPQEAQLQASLQTLERLQDEKNILQAQSVPDAPEAPGSFSGYTDPIQAVQTAKADFEAQEALEHSRKKQAKLVPMAAIGLAVFVILATVITALVLGQGWVYMVGGGLLALGVILIFTLSAGKAKAYRRQLDAIYDRHPGLSPDKWVVHAENYRQQHESYSRKLAQRQAQLDTLALQKEELDKKLAAVTGGESAEQCCQQWQDALSIHRRLADARQALEQTKHHAQTVRSMVKAVEPPKEPDKLTLSERETQRALTAAQLEQHQLQLRLGQAMGQAEVLGQESLIRARLDTLNRRIARLEDTYHALELAQDALYRASTSLQRRFAPMISKHAQELFEKLTDGRYQRIAMAEDLTLSTGAQNEDTLHSAQWRSDGTIDQLYLALRLAVARELTPDAPLVLDDALVRFDDERLKKAMEILKEEAKDKQVIIFTCQEREKAV